MAGKLECLVLHSLKTFKNISRSAANIVDDANIAKLVNLANEVKFNDLNIPARLLNKDKETLHARDPVAHFAFYEDQDVSIGVFILKEGAKIPLHDHPGMHGLLRVVHGSVKIDSYDLVDVPPDNVPSSTLFYSKPINAVKNPAITLNCNDGCSVLTPVRNNIHEVTCISGPAAFLDILSPPYSDDCHESAERSCHYFKKTEVGLNVVKLSQIPCPRNFWFDQECGD